MKWKFWKDFDADGNTGHYCIGPNLAAPIAVTCADGTRETAELIVRAVNGYNLVAAVHADLVVLLNFAEGELVERHDIVVNNVNHDDYSKSDRALFKLKREKVERAIKALNYAYGIKS